MSSARKQCLLLFGPPGSGKGTQAEKLVEKKSYAHISTGDIFRENFRKETALGAEAKKYVDAGHLVPDSITLGMLKDAIANLKENQFILDGFPRTLDQAEQLEALSEELKFDITKVIFLQVPDEVLFERLTGRRICKSCGTVYHMSSKPPVKAGICDKCGGDVYQRKDDSKDVIAHRLKTYEQSTAPVKRFYEEVGNLVILDGAGTPQSIEKKVLEIVNK